MSLAEAALATGLVVIAPGPALAISLSSAVEGGRRAGLQAIAGLAAGIVLHAAVAAAGISALLAADARVQRGLQVAGALFLALVGARMIVRGLRPAAPSGTRARSPRTTYFARGLLTNVLNPWILGFYLAILPVLAGSGSALPAAASIAGIHVAQLALWHGLLVVTASSAAALDGSRGQALRVAVGAALVATGGWLLLR